MSKSFRSSTSEQLLSPFDSFDLGLKIRDSNKDQLDLTHNYNKLLESFNQYRFDSQNKIIQLEQKVRSLTLENSEEVANRKIAQNERNSLEKQVTL